MASINLLKNKFYMEIILNRAKKQFINFIFIP